MIIIPLCIQDWKARSQGTYLQSLCKLALELELELTFSNTWSSLLLILIPWSHLYFREMKEAISSLPCPLVKRGENPAMSHNGQNNVTWEKTISIGIRQKNLYILVSTLLSAGVWAASYTSLSLSFPIFKMKIECYFCRLLITWGVYGIHIFSGTWWITSE